MEILGYGEDGLTLLYFCTSLPHFLVHMGDQARPEECTVYYRASFGRGGGFGEFDAIVVTPSIVYACESKWNDRERSRVTAVQLEEPQVRRNKIFKDLLTTWLHDQPVDWADFCDQHATGINGFALPGTDTTTARNLSSIFNRLKGHPGTCQNVLCYFYRSNMITGLPFCVADHNGQPLEDYKIVKVKYSHGEVGSHFRLPSRTLEGSPGTSFEIESRHE